MDEVKDNAKHIGMYLYILYGDGSNERMVGQVGFGSLDWRGISGCDWCVLRGYATATPF